MRATAAFIAAALSIIALLASDATAATPLQTVQEHVSYVLDILQEPVAGAAEASARSTRIRDAVVDLFDFAEMTHRILGQHSSARSEPEQIEFAALVQDLLERSFVTTLQNYAHEGFVYEDEAVDGTYATVKSRIVTRRGLDLSVDYRLHVTADQRSWKVFDVAIEDCSVVANYRAQFDRIIRKASFDGLMERLRQKQIDLVALRPHMGEERARGPALLLAPLLSRRRH